MKHSIKTSKTAHYHTLGNIKEAKNIWFVLHGYGYLAEYFIKKFEPIQNTDTCIIAPEGFSKFYLKGVDGRLGASWMTKDNREEEIIDYINYLNLLYTTILEGKTNIKINILGFSQGGATASRWISNGKIHCDNFILWSSIFPEDMKFKTIPKNTNTYILYGNDDKYLTQERLDKQLKFINSSQLKHKIIPFIGEHDIPKEILIEQTVNNKW